MSLHQVATFFLIVGCAVLIIGLADIALTAVRPSAHKVRDSLIGAAPTVLGALILWLSQQRAYTHQLDLGPYEISGILLLLFVFGLFILRSVMNIQEGQARLKRSALSQFGIWKNRFQIATGIIVLVWFVFLLLLLFSHVMKFAF